MWRRHEHIDDQTLSLYLDGQLDEATRSRVEAHIQSCAACRESLETLQQTVHLVRHVPRVVPPRAFTLSEADVKRPRQAATSWGWTRWASALVAALLVLTVGLDVFLNTWAPQGAPPPAVETALVEKAAIKETAALQAHAEQAPTPMMKSLSVPPPGQLETSSLTATPMPTPAPSPTPVPTPPTEEHELPPVQPAPLPHQWPWYRWLEIILAAALATLIVLSRRRAR